MSIQVPRPQQVPFEPLLQLLHIYCGQKVGVLHRHSTGFIWMQDSDPLLDLDVPDVAFRHVLLEIFLGSEQLDQESRHRGDFRVCLSSSR